MNLMPGDKLAASCSAECYADILEVFPKHLTLLVHRVDDLIDHEDLDVMDERCKKDPEYAAWRAEYCPNLIISSHPVRVEEVYIERYDAQDWGGTWEHITNEPGWSMVGYIVLDTPGNNCYRCTKAFSVLRKVAP